MRPVVMFVDNSRPRGGCLRTGCGCVVGLFALLGLVVTILVVAAAIAGGPPA